MKSENNNIWDQIAVGWILIWTVGSIALFFLFRPEMVAGIGLLLTPFIICGFFIPFFIIYQKSDLSFLEVRKRIFGVGSGRSKKIRYFCLVTIPATIFFIMYLLKYPESYLNFGPQYTKQFVYNLAFIQLVYLIAYVGYWNERRWGIYLYMSNTVFSILVRNYGFGIPIRGIDIIWDLFVIVYGYIYMPNRAEKKL